MRSCLLSILHCTRNTFVKWLFINHRLSFSTINPSKFINKLRDWVSVLPYATGFPHHKPQLDWQHLLLCDHQHRGNSRLHDCAAIHSSNIILIFTDLTSIGQSTGGRLLIWFSGARITIMHSTLAAPRTDCRLQEWKPNGPCICLHRQEGSGESEQLHVPGHTHLW